MMSGPPTINGVTLTSLLHRLQLVMEFQTWASRAMRAEARNWELEHVQQSSPSHAWSQVTVPAPAPLGIHGSPEGNIAWIRSQIPGRAAEFTTPFGTKRLITYADHTASGQPLLQIENVIAQLVQRVYGNTLTEVGQSTCRAVDQAGDFLKWCMGGTEDHVLFLCGSGTTTAIKKLQQCIGVLVPHFLLSRARKEIKLEDRWVVFLGPYEHHSNLLSWRESLAEVVEIPMDKSGRSLDMKKLKEALQNPTYADRPKLGCFSAASNVTGLVTDTRAVARLLHDFDAFACFDFAASGPHVKIDMRAGQVDAYDAVVLSPHKFLGGPGSSGILLLSKDLYLLDENPPPSSCGSGTLNYINGLKHEETLYVEHTQHREEAGTPAMLQKLRAALAFWVKEMVGYELVDSREHYFITTAIQRLGDNPFILILGNAQAERCPILSFVIYSKELHETVAAPQSPLHVLGHNTRVTAKPRLADWQTHDRGTLRKGKMLSARFVVKLLNDLFGVQARGGCACAGPYGHYLLGIDNETSLALREAIKQGYHAVKTGFARVSFAYYMNKDEFEFILSAIEFVAEHGQRFLPMYDMNWKTGDWTCKRKIGARCGDAQPLADTHPKFLEEAYVGVTHEAPHSAMDLSDTSVADKYQTYLDAALVTASFQEEFPCHGAIPIDIDPALLDFRI